MVNAKVSPLLKKHEYQFDGTLSQRTYIYIYTCTILYILPIMHSEQIWSFSFNIILHTDLISHDQDGLEFASSGILVHVIEIS